MVLGFMGQICCEDSVYSCYAIVSISRPLVTQIIEVLSHFRLGNARGNCYVSCRSSFSVAALVENLPTIVFFHDENVSSEYIKF